MGERRKFGRAAAAAAMVIGLGAGTIGPAPSATAAPMCGTTDGVVTCAFGYTGAADTWVVPDAALVVDAELAGAGGGSLVVSGSTFYEGGPGGHAQAALDATAGDSWEVRVGGGGGDVGGCVTQETPPAGGFNGGADGVQVGTCEAPSGGGATDLRIGGSTLGNRVLVAGGGGGATNGGCCTTGGAGGGMAGGDGVRASGAVGDAATPGQGGNADGTTGSGLPGVGSIGAEGSSGFGGSGGGGWFGGSGAIGEAGGGGGSGYAPIGGTLTTGAGAAASQAGSAQIRYPDPAAPIAIDAGADGSTIAFGWSSGSHPIDVELVWGTAPGALPFTAGAQSLSAGTGSGTFTMTDLAPGQTYWFRLITTMAGVGASRSPETSFTTLPPTVAGDLALRTDEDEPVTAALAATGPDLTFATDVPPAHGTVSYSGSNVTYQPAANFDGTDTFTYRATSTTTSLSDTGVVTVTVDAVDDLAVANPDSFQTGFGQPVSGNVLANDTGVEGPLTATLTAAPTSGTVELSADGTFTYTPDNGFSGTDTYTYRATDGVPSIQPLLAIDDATVTIVVAAAPPDETTTTAPVPPSTSPPASSAAPMLPSTGGSTAGTQWAALALLFAGVGLAAVGVRRRRAVR